MLVPVLLITAHTPSFSPQSREASLQEVDCEAHACQDEEEDDYDDRDGDVCFDHVGGGLSGVG